jgi:uncharacterized pyridoxal phosphate-containing UPF0001 family protein
VLVQINSSGEKAKSGFLLGEKDKIQRCAENKNIKIEGLMTMGPNTKNKKEIEKALRKQKSFLTLLTKANS